MTTEEISNIREQHTVCMRLAKAFIAATRKFGDQLYQIYDEIPVTADVAADEDAWLDRIEDQLGISPEEAILCTDFSLMPEVQSAPALPSQAMTLYDALEILTYLTPCGAATELETTAV